MKATPRLAVIVPVHNEGATVAHILSRLGDSPCVSEIVVVDDRSTDDTLQVIQRWHLSGDSARRPRCTLLRHKRSLGKGAAIRTALAEVTAPVFVVQDGDLEYDPGDLPALLAPILAGDADAVYGSRYLRPSRDALQQPRGCRCGVSLLNFAVRLLYGVRLSDEATCYKMFGTKLVRRMALECERFEFCPEVTAKACRMGARIVEVPISYRPRSYAEGKKIRWWDGIEALWTLWRFRNWQPGTAPVVELESSAAGATQPGLRATSHVV